MNEDSQIPPEDGIPDLPDFLKRQKSKIPDKKVFDPGIPKIREITALEFSSLLDNSCPACGTVTDLVIRSLNSGFYISCHRCGFDRVVSHEEIQTQKANVKKFSTKLLGDRKRL